MIASPTGDWMPNAPAIGSSPPESSCAPSPPAPPPPHATAGGGGDVSFPPCPMPATMYFVVVCGPGSDTTGAVVPAAVQETTARSVGKGEG